MKYFHTGTNSFDNPEIKSFEMDDYNRDIDFSNGPFDTFAEAKIDLIEFIYCDIRNLKHCLANVRKLKG